MRPDTLTSELEVVGRLRVIWRRLVIRRVLNGAAAGAGVVAVGVAVIRLLGLYDPLVTPLIASTVVLVVAWIGSRREALTAAAAARAAERALPSAKNVVFTALELHQFPDRASSRIADRVFRDAAAQLRPAAPGDVVPLVRPAAIAAAALACAAASFAIPIPSTTAYIDVIRAAGGLPARHAMIVQVQLTPPSYLGLSPSVVTGPEVSAIENSRLRVTLSGDVDGSRIRFGTQPLPSVAHDGMVTADLQLVASGYLAVERGGHPEEPARLVSVTVLPDRPPAIKIDAPAKDLIVPDTRAAIEVRGTASDDYALRAMSLVYTKVSGSGEQFEFSEGEIPVSVSRDSARSWRARGEVPLARLGLQPGDSIVYRVTARDLRPGDAGLASSDTYFVEIAGPGQVALEGFEMPPEQERYALSQQMIVIKIQRLIERRAALNREALESGASAIAAEQRAVRANFVFLMGGHVEDEEEEAEHSNEIQEGRLENTARREISKAVAHMSATEVGLVALDTKTALAQARLAAEALQRAFGRNRYILRALATRSRIDLSRRLSGALDEARDSTRRVEPMPEPPGSAVARELLIDLLRLKPRLEADASAVRGEVTRLAERAMGAEPGSARWSSIGRQMLELRDDTSADAATRDRRVRAIVLALVGQARSSAEPASSEAIQPPDRLRSAWVAGARRR